MSASSSVSSVRPALGYIFLPAEVRGTLASVTRLAKDADIVYKIGVLISHYTIVKAFR